MSHGMGVRGAVAADGGVLVHAAEVAHPAELPFAPAAEEDYFVGFAPMASRSAFFMRNLLVSSTLLADAVAVPFALLLADLAETRAATKAHLGTGGLNGQSLLITALAMAEALPDHPFMLHTDFLHAGLALIAARFLPGTVVSDGRIRATLSADHQVLLGLYFSILQEFLDEAAGNGRGVHFGVHDTF